MGTASRVRGWFLLEQPGPWGADALIESQLDPLVGRVLLAQGRRFGIRVLLIRQPGWRDVGPRRCYLAQSTPDHSWIEQRDLEDAREVLAFKPRALGSEGPPGWGAPGPSVLHLVCTNGRHDKCCADYGRPVVRALAAAGTPGVWESSHVGGDRFAANVVCLPSGVYFGRVEPDEAAPLLADFERGLIRLERYRGRSCFPPMVQAAEIFARRELDERRLDGVRILSAEGEGPDRVRAVVAQANGVTLEVTVERERGELEHLTCGDTGSGRPWRYRLVGLRVVQSG